MNLYSTNNKEHIVDLKTAVIKGLPPDNGLYMPCNINPLPESFFNEIDNYSFAEIGFHFCKNLIGPFLAEESINEIVDSAINFPAPIVKLDNQTAVLELFHGPSLAFKDFGARFMARLMAYFNKDEDKELHILVATSGDTGGAVAAGFYKTPGIKVTILYPSGKVSALQEKQLTTLGHNIKAIEVKGSFDDCQALVKQAFLDKELNEYIRLSSANSINIARLIPQAFYYLEAFKQCKLIDKEPIFVIPSGNFGNLTAGLFAKRMGMENAKFIAATNVNDSVPRYLNGQPYQSNISVPTISNAMDVGKPSNFARMLDMYNEDQDAMASDIKGFSFNDEQTKSGLLEVFQKFNYIIDPHGAVAYQAWQSAKAKQQIAENQLAVLLETAHPSKFIDVVEPIIGEAVEIPERLACLAERVKVSTLMGTSFEDFKEILLADGME